MTVLSQPASDRHDAAVRWRQLVDLVARAGSNSASAAVEQALEAIRSEGPAVDETLRAATARAVAALPLPLSLLQILASDRLAVSAPVLAAATLDAGQWRALHEVADHETRRFIETLHPDAKPGFVANFTDTLVEPAPEQAAERADDPPPGSASLHDVVARIERRRQVRATVTEAAVERPVPPPGSPALFRWECGPGGEIAWVEGAPRGAMIGRSIARSVEGGGDHVDHEVVRAFAQRAPFRDAMLTVAGEGLLSGEWKISGVPAFEPVEGRFAGYRGVALRETAPAPVPASAADLLADPDSLRELVHEIKTPLNAIIGFAEIIEGQYLGPADRRYRARAQEIVRQARLLVTAIDDLDFAATLHSPGEARERTDLPALVARAAELLNQAAAGEGVDVTFDANGDSISAAVEPELAERLLIRLVSALIARSHRGDRLRLAVEQAQDGVRISIRATTELRGAIEHELLGDHGDTLEDGFSLRLVRGLARIGGGDLVADGGGIALVFPRG